MADKKKYLGSITKKTKFKQLPIKPEVQSLLQEQGLVRPTLVQAQSLPITLQENLRDLCTIVYAYNGAGKTLTYLIPILNSLEMIPEYGVNSKHIKDQQVIRPQAIIILPTEALMTQVYEYLVAFSLYYQINYKWPLKIGKIYGGAKKHQQSGHIIVGMAAKLKTMFKTQGFFDLSELKWIVFDECDQIRETLESEFKQILKVFSNKLENLYANFLITSATGEKVAFREFIQENLPNHNILELDSKQQNKGLEGVTHYYAPDQNKNETILKILEILSGLQNKPQVIIFFNEIKQMSIFYQMLKQQKKRFVINDPTADSKGMNNINVNYVHSRVGPTFGQNQGSQDSLLNKSQRVSQLRNGTIQVLLGTQTIGRGIDIRTVSLVINYSQPKKKNQQLSPTTYIHRVGRTGRYTDEGIALTFVTNKLFLKLTQDEQNIKFSEMKSEKQIVEEMLVCSKKNEQQTGKMRWAEQD